jgi:hypothetical protein
MTAPPFLRLLSVSLSIAAAPKAVAAPRGKSWEGFALRSSALRCEVARGRRRNSKRGASGTSDRRASHSASHSARDHQKSAGFRAARALSVSDGAVRTVSILTPVRKER